MRACAAAPELLEVYLERIARLDSQLRCYRVVLADREQQQHHLGRRRVGGGRGHLGGL
ncbi:hypothetical protein MAHJHV55_52690 [Mycobacterium avium subsp. hominissuis]